MTRDRIEALRRRLVPLRNQEADFSKQMALTVLVNMLDNLHRDPDDQRLQAAWPHQWDQYERTFGPIPQQSD